MGKMTAITPEQHLLLDEFKKDPFLTSHFYFTGGTALSLYYLQHPQSIDLDFFTEDEFDPPVILTKINSWADTFNLSIDYIPIEQTHVFNLHFPHKREVKVDFAFYPYKQVEKSQVLDGITVDSLLDIAVNKQLAVQQRSEVKDFVDLYFLLQEFTVWDLIEGVKVKFKVNLDPLIVGSDFLKVDGFDFLPTMIKPLTLKALKSFFRQKAKDIGEKSVK